ncbi:MAG: ATP-binding protein [Thermoleophilaceae bacterium]|nr:ATP-binding protein [Thermoleophilaceae bacterium]
MTSMPAAALDPKRVFLLRVSWVETVVAPFQAHPLNEETLRAVLSDRAERDDVDFKLSCDLNNRGELVAITKDIGAMLMEGGYIIVGVDNDGQPGDGLDERQAGLFDPATLTAKVARYLAPGFDVKSTSLQVDGHRFAMVAIAPHPDVIVAFAADGTYERDGRTRTEFRRGDVYARHGTRSEVWNDDDVARCRQRMREEEHERARASFANDLAAVTRQMQRTGGLAQAPLGALTWTGEPADLTAAVLEQIRHSDEIPVRLLAPTLATAVIDPQTTSEAINTALDTAASLVGGLLMVGRTDIAGEIIDGLKATYDATFEDHLDRRDLAVDPAELRLRVITRVWALGGLATRRGHWSTVRRLAEHAPPVHDANYWSNWLFHGLVWAARGNLLQDPQDARGKSPLVIAQEHTMRLRWLHPDVAPTSEQVLSSICQFDLLSNLVAIDSAIGNPDPFLGHFGRWYARRTDPAVVTVIEDAEARAEIFPQGDDELREALAMIAANTEGRGQGWGGWGGYEDPRIIRFLRPAEGAAAQT